MRGDVYLVYHDPGSPKGLDMIKMMINIVGEASATRIHAIPISNVERSNAPFNKDSMVYALFAFRGGHLATILDRVRASGACYLGKPSIKLIARGLSRCLYNCDSILVFYWKAKRFVEEQVQDVMELASLLSNMTKAKVRISPNMKNNGGEDCIIVTSFMPGRLTDRALTIYGSRVVIPYLLSCVMNDVALDIVTRIKMGCRKAKS